MADENAIRAGRAFVELFTDDSSMRAGLVRSEAFFQAWGKAMSSAGSKMLLLGGVSEAPFLAIGKVFGDMGAEIARFSQRTGVSVESASQLKYAAEQAGVGLDQLQLAFVHLDKTMLGSAEGSKEQTKALNDIGLSISDLNGLTPDDQFKKIADGFAGIRDPAERAGLAVKIFGRSGADLLPLLDAGGKGIDGLMNKANSLGLTMSRDDAMAALDFSQRLSDLWDTVKMGVFQIGGALAPVMRLLATETTSAIHAITGFIREHRTMVAIVGGGIAALSAGLLIGGGALLAFGKTFEIVAFAVSPFRIALAALPAVFGLVGTSLGLVFSSGGLIVAGIAVATAALLKFSGIGAAIGNAFATAFAGFGDSLAYIFKHTSTLGEAWSAIMGDIVARIGIAWASFENDLILIWDHLKEIAKITWNDLAGTIISAATRGMEAYLLFGEYVQKIFDRISASAAAVILKPVVYAQAKNEVETKYSGVLTNDQADSIGSEEAERRKLEYLKQQQDRIRADIQARANNDASSPEEAKRLAGSYAIGRQGPSGLLIDDKASSGMLQVARDTEAEYRRMYAGRKLSEQELAAIADRLAEHRVKLEEDHLNNASSKRQAQDQAEIDAIKATYNARVDAQNKLTDQKSGDIARASEDEINAAKKFGSKMLLEAKGVLSTLEDTIGTHFFVSGAKSLVDQFKDLFKINIPDLGTDPDGHGDLSKIPGSARGTFETSALFGFGGGGAADRMAKHTEAIAKSVQETAMNTAKIAAKVQGGRPLTYN